MTSDTIATGRRRGRDGLRRFGSPVGLAGVLLCLLLPFLSASCGGAAPELPQAGRLTWTGTDIVTGGRPDVYYTDHRAAAPPHRIGAAEVAKRFEKRPPPLRPQPWAWVAVALTVAAIAVAASGVTRRRAAVTAGLTLVA